MKRVYLEITNSCNLNCPFCDYPKGHDFLSIDEIKDYLKQIKPYCNYVYLHIIGEPLLHPDFDEVLNTLDDMDMQLQLVTNGTLLYKYPDILNHSCLRKLSISVHSVNGINIDTDYFKTIDRLIETETDKNIELRFYDKDNLSDNINNYLSQLEKKYSFTITSKTDSYRIKDNVYIYYQKLFKWPDINDEIISSNGTCHGAIDMIAINSKSEVTLCCLDPLGLNSIGNLKKNTLKDILESNQYLKYIESFKNHQLISDLCKRCTYRLRFK